MGAIPDAARPADRRSWWGDDGRSRRTRSPGGTAPAAVSAHPASHPRRRGRWHCRPHRGVRAVGADCLRPPRPLRRHRRRALWRVLDRAATTAGPSPSGSGPRGCSGFSAQSWPIVSIGVVARRCRWARCSCRPFLRSSEPRSSGGRPRRRSARAGGGCHGRRCRPSPTNEWACFAS